MPLLSIEANTANNQRKCHIATGSMVRHKVMELKDKPNILIPKLIYFVICSSNMGCPFQLPSLQDDQACLMFVKCGFSRARLPNN